MINIKVFGFFIMYVLFGEITWVYNCLGLVKFILKLF